MSTYTDKVTETTPRIEVRHRNIDGRNEYEWGIAGNMPLLETMGAVRRAQIELHSSSEFLDPANTCPEHKFILAWDSESKSFSWFVHPDIDTDSLIGFLDTINLTVGMGLEARRRTAQAQVILGPDGRPMQVN